MKKTKNIFDSSLFYTLIAILIGFAIGAVFLVIAGISPAVAYGKLFDAVFGKPKNLVWTLMYSAPVILTGLSVAFSFKTGVFNIGAEGQFVMGTLAATVLGIALDLPAGLHAIVCILGAAVAGFVWSMLVAILKVTKGIHEVLSFIMFNWIAFYFSNFVVGIERFHSESGAQASRDVKDTARILFSDEFRKTIDCSAANWSIIIAIVIAIIVWFVIEKTALGYNLKAVGSNRHAAEFAGIDANKSVLISLGISGALAGIGGAVQVLGMGGRLAELAAQEGYGFEGITVALIGASNPIGCIFAGLFYGAMKFGGSKLTIVKAPSEIVNIIMGCVIIVIAVSNVLKLLKNRREK